MLILKSIILISFLEAELMSARDNLGFTMEDVILTFVGTFGKWHGVEVLAEVIRNLYELDPKWLHENKVKFLLVGDGACMSQVKVFSLLSLIIQILLN